MQGGLSDDDEDEDDDEDDDDDDDDEQSKIDGQVAHFMSHFIPRL